MDPRPATMLVSLENAFKHVLCCSYIRIILLYYFLFNGFMALTKKTTEPQIPLLTATATQRREITKYRHKIERHLIKNSIKNRI